LTNPKLTRKLKPYEDFDVAKLYEQTNLGKDDVNSIDGGYTTQIISEDKLKECPKVKFAVQLESRV
jgi:hypothetical protein